MPFDIVSHTPVDKVTLIWRDGKTVDRTSMTLATSGIVASIVPFDPTIGISAVAALMLTVFVLVMVFLAVAPIVSSSWADQLSATTAPSAARSAEPSDD